MRKTDICALLLLWAHGIAGGDDADWTRWVVVNVCPTRVYRDAWKSDAKRLKLVRDFDPDVCDWWSGVALNRGNFFAMRGVASSSQTEYEYQEAIGPMWGFARKLFSGNGMAIRENGHWARFPKGFPRASRLPGTGFPGRLPGT